jgi:hypothetical protein
VDLDGRNNDIVIISTSAKAKEQGCRHQQQTPHTKHLQLIHLFRYHKISANIPKALQKQEGLQKKNTTSPLEFGKKGAESPLSLAAKEPLEYPKEKGGVSSPFVQLKPFGFKRLYS